MEFIGKSNLIGNIYDTIILEDDNDNCEVRCNAISKNKLNYLDYNVVGNFRSSLDSIDSDYDKALAVIDYFTDYNEISYIYDKWDLLDKKDSIADSSNKIYKFLFKHRVVYDESMHRKYLKSLEKKAS